MAETRVFNKSIFESYANLQTFFNRSNAIQEVLEKKIYPILALLTRWIRT
jgi:hypothetical protein